MLTGVTGCRVRGIPSIRDAGLRHFGFMPRVCLPLGEVWVASLFVSATLLRHGSTAAVIYFCIFGPVGVVSS